MPESLWERCHLDSISTVFEAIFPYYSIMTFLLNFRDFWVFSFGYRSQKENPEITENLYFSFYKVPIHMNLFFHHYFNNLNAKTKTNKKLLNLVNLDGLALKRQKYDIWIAMWLKHFENDVIWTAFQLFLKLHSHITVFWRFCRIPKISKFSILGTGLKTKTRKSWKISIFGSTKFKCIWIYFLITI